MARPHFTLTVATSEDGFISPTTDTPTESWVSAEEQALFFADINAADWCIMGRHTHDAADKPDRHRIIFSSTMFGWQRPTQLWLNPKTLNTDDLGEAVQGVRPLHKGLILGGTRVHDWFLAQAAIDVVHLTVEPVRFDHGVPVFTGQGAKPPLSILKARGFHVASAEILNETGTRFYKLLPTADKLSE